MNAKKGVVCFSYLCACSSSPAPVWVSVDLLLWSLLSLPAACAWCSATGVKVWATAPSCCLSGWMRRGRETQNEFSNQSSPVQLCVSNPPPSFTLTSSRCCTPWSSCWWGHGWWRPRSKKRKKKEGRKQKETIGDGEGIRCNSSPLPTPTWQAITDLYVTCCYQVTQVRPLESHRVGSVVGS